MNKQTAIEAATLSGAMALAFAAIEKATAKAENSHFKSKYADLSAVIAAIKPALVAHGLFFTQHPQPSTGGVTVETVLHHSSGESLSLGSLYVPANKQDAHGFGSALSYCRRYGLVTAFGVPVEDDDGNAAVKAGAEPPSALELITDGQVVVLQGYAQGGVIDTNRFCNFFQIDRLSDLPADRYEEALSMAQAKQEKLTKVLEPVK